MRIAKYTAALLACLFIVFTGMGGCTKAEPSPTVPTTAAPTEPEGYRIPENAYLGSDITEFTVADTVKIIDGGAFSDCKALKDFYCTSRDISIHENAFSGTKNVVFPCYLDSTADLFAREQGYDRVYFDAFSIRCDTVKNGCVGLPITWTAVDVMPGQHVPSWFVYTLYLNDEPIFTSELTAEDSFTYTPTKSGQYTLTVDIQNKLTASSLTGDAVPVADRLFMGMCEQDNDPTSAEPIEWRILTVEDGKALILTEHPIERGSYFNPEWIKYKYTYWSHSCIAETSSVNYWGSQPKDPSRQFGNLTPESVPLGWYAERGPETELFYLHARYWCNEIFYKEYLSAEEQERVLLSDIPNPDNPRYGTEGGPDTQDYAFFLSYDELETYLPTVEDRKTTYTAYVKNLPSIFGDTREYYWLRTPGAYPSNAMYLWANEGILDRSGSDVGHNNVGYRPAMWITVGG